MAQVPITVPSGMAVAIAMPTYDKLPPRTAQSLFSTAQACGQLGVSCDLIITTGIVELARDLALSEFLAGKAQKLFWIDADMVWEPEAFLRMVALSTRFDVLCAAYRHKAPGAPQHIINWTPGLPANEFGLLPINGTGLGFTIVDRKVCQAISDAAPLITDHVNGRQQRAVFRVDVVDGHRRTEDMAFFADIAALGHTIWLDPTITLGHIGSWEWRGRLLDAFGAGNNEAAAVQPE